MATCRPSRRWWSTADDVVTGGGVSLGIDTMLYLLGRLYGERKADEVARLLEYDRARAANMAGLTIRQAVPAQ